MRIVGFGACMIAGKPYEKEDSFFNIYINLLKQLHIDIGTYEVVSLGGFPINRAKKYLDKKVLPFNPDAVIVQFGSTDVQLNFKKALKSKITFNLLKIKSSKNNGNSKKPDKEPIKANKYIPYYDNVLKRFLRMAKMSIKLVLIYTLKLTPITPKSVYISSLEEIICNLLNSNIRVIVLSPFLCADPIANMFTKQYIKAIRELSNKYDFIFVDCFTPLSKYRLDEVLLCDGLHISSKAHDLIANELLASSRQAF